MPRRAEPDIYICKEQFHAEIDGEQVFIPRGRRVRRGDALARAYPEYFEPADAGLPPVEQATAAPGERRER